MRDNFSKMLSKKRSLSENEKKAKMDVMSEISQAAKDAMNGKLQKVSVMSDSDEGLKKGLEKAEDILENKEMSEESEKEEGEDISPMEASESEEEEMPMSEEDIDAKIAELLEMKKKMYDGGEVDEDEKERQRREKGRQISESFMGALGSGKK